MDEIERENIDNQINTYRQMLANTDYMAIKHADGALSEEDYAAVRAERQTWRDRINELQEILAAG